MFVLGRMRSRETEVLSLLKAVTIVADERARQALIQACAHPERPFVLSFVNQHALNLAWREQSLCGQLKRSDLLLRDGVGLEVLYGLLGHEAGANCNGTDFIPAVLRVCEGQSILIFGTRNPWLDAAAKRVGAIGLDVRATLEGFEKPERYLALARELKPDVVLLGMGMPRQERLSLELRAALVHPCLIINGGAIVDFLGGRFPRAPKWIRALRLEWLFRLGMEPRRLASRYLYGGAVFGLRAIKIAHRARAKAA